MANLLEDGEVSFQVKVLIFSDTQWMIMTEENFIEMLQIFNGRGGNQPGTTIFHSDFIFFQSGERCNNNYSLSLRDSNNKFNNIILTNNSIDLLLRFKGIICKQLIIKSNLIEYYTEKFSIFALDYSEHCENRNVSLNAKSLLSYAYESKNDFINSIVTNLPKFVQSYFETHLL